MSATKQLRDEHEGIKLMLSCFGEGRHNCRVWTGIAPESRRIGLAAPATPTTPLFPRWTPTGTAASTATADDN